MFFKTGVTYLAYRLNALGNCKQLKILDVSDNAFGNAEDSLKALERLIVNLTKLTIHKGSKTKSPITANQVYRLRKTAPHVEIISDRDLE